MLGQIIMGSQLPGGQVWGMSSVEKRAAHGEPELPSMEDKKGTGKDG